MWFVDIIFDEFRSGKINLEKSLKLLNKFDLSYDFVHVRKVFKVRICTFVPFQNAVILFVTNAPLKVDSSHAKG